MNKFPEGLKFFMDVRKNKHKENARCTKRNVEQENKNLHITPDVLQNSCFYCTKVFFTSSHLLKHILKRHSNEVINFHKKYSQSDPCDLKSLFTFLEAEFSELKREIYAVKQAIGFEVSKCKDGEEPLTRPKEAVCYPAKVIESSGAIMTDSHYNEVQNFESKLNSIEDKVHLLCGKLEENDKNINSKFLLKQDFHQYISHKQEKILRKQEAQFDKMRQVLLAELNNVLDKQLCENNVNWNAKMTELKTDILKLDQVLADIRKQINSPDYLQGVERKLENQIFNFLDNIGQTAMKRKNLKPKPNSIPKPKTYSLPKPKTYSSLKTNTYSSLKLKTDSLPKIDALNNDSTDSQVSLKDNLFQLNHSPEKPLKDSNITPENLRALIAEKLSSFGIFHDTLRVSNSEYEEKIRLVNTNKDYLKMLYDNFSEVYNCVNISADQRVLSKLRPKQNRKLRFSEPLILEKDISSKLLPNKADFLNKTCPVLNEEINHSDIYKPFVSSKHAIAVPKSEGFIFQDDSGSGDGCDKFQDDYEKHVKKMFDNTERKKFLTSSPVIEADGVSKSRNTFSRNYSFVECNELSSEEKNIKRTVSAKSASDIILDYDTVLNKTFIKYHNNKADVCNQISETDYEESLESLSSFEDDSFANNSIK